MPLKLPSVRDIINNVGEIVYLRGRDYFESGRVIDHETRNGEIVVRVLGRSSEPYTVRIYPTVRKQLISSCSCPYKTGSCKHTVAAILYLSSDPEASGPVPASTSSMRQMPASHTIHESLLTRYGNRLSIDEPVIQLRFNSFGISDHDKGIKIQLKVLYEGKIIIVRSAKEFPDLSRSSDYYAYKPNYQLPRLSQFDPTQRRILKLIDSFTSDYYHDSIRLKPLHFSLILNEIESGNESFQLFDLRSKNPITVRSDVAAPVWCGLSLTKSNKLIVKMAIQDPDSPGARICYPDIIEGDPVWVYDRRGLRLLRLTDGIDQETVVNFIDKELVIGADQMPYFFKYLLPEIQRNGTVVYEDERLKNFRIDEHKPVMRLYMDYKNKKIAMRIESSYPDKVFNLFDFRYSETFYRVDGSDFTKWSRRDNAAEAALVKKLVTYCKFEYSGRDRSFLLSDAEHIFDFIYDKIPELAKSCELFYSGNFEKTFLHNKLVTPRVSVYSDRIDWFHFDVKYSAGSAGGEFSHDDIRKALLSGKRYIRLKTGELVPISRKAFDKIDGIIDEYDGSGNALPIFHIPFLLEEAGNGNIEVEISDTLKKRYDELTGFKSIKTIDMPKRLDGVLRDYQKKGVEWLEFLRYFGFGGILADEMGLGKTLQALTMIEQEKVKGSGRPSLIVCPKTLIWNWQEEVRKFLPHHKALILTGADRREAMSDIGQSDIVITSYPILRRDIAHYQGLEFHYIILDEAQNIKNRHTLNAKVCKALKGHYRLALTGTPMENSIADIWSIFDFLMPSFLCRYEAFSRIYENPIIKDNDHAKLNMLFRKMRPFLLRRLKREVLKELPDKMEQVSYCELEPTQASIYKETLRLAQQDVLKSVNERGFDRSRMYILTVILRLRQICCHPEIAGISTGHRIGMSGKLELLKELLSEALSGNHKILIFSQFVEMLRIIKDYLEKEKIQFEYMDGSVGDRKSPVDRFNSGDEIRVFLLSLKVGGTGLNLTSADTVILYEPWWNPAVEDQAIDRTHRIGQTNRVTAYKLITRGTIEEKIVELQRRKKSLIDSLVVAEDGIAKKLTWQDIKYLLDM